MSHPTHGRERRPARPFDAATLEQLAVGYLGRYATTRVRLARYLARKVAERGWSGEGEPPIERIVGRCAELGYVDDAAFAAARGAALQRRGFGARRVAEDLKSAGVAIAEARPVQEAAREDALAAAVAFARRKRIGPFAREPRRPDRERNEIAMMIRAGHDFAVSRRIVGARSEEDILD